jgi:isoleucyl-tRNA synthetase
MSLLREIASLGRAARGEAKLKVRQPLASVTVILNEQTDRDWLEEHASILRDELNVLRIDYAANAADYVSYKIQPNFKLVGPRVGSLMPQVKEALGKAPGARLLDEMNRTGKVSLAVADQTIELGPEEIQIRLEAKPGRAAAQGSRSVAVLDTQLTPELIREGLANDVIRLVQELRKERELQYTDRIHLALVASDAELNQAIAENADRIKSETLAVQLDLNPLDQAEPAEREASGKPLTIYLRVVR